MGAPSLGTLSASLDGAPSSLVWCRYPRLLWGLAQGTFKGPFPPKPSWKSGQAAVSTFIPLDTRNKQLPLGS